jgi:phosphoglycolate phosphatase
MRHCGCTEEEAYEARRVFRTHYSAGAMYDAQPYGGIRELLGELAASGCQLGVATNKQQDLAQDLLRHFGFDGFFGGIYGADAGGRREKAETIQLALEHFGVEPTSTVLIGDTAHDATAAAQTGIAFAAVTYGYGFTDEASVVPYPHIGVAGSPAEMLGLLD